MRIYYFCTFSTSHIGTLAKNHLNELRKASLSQNIIMSNVSAEQKTKLNINKTRIKQATITALYYDSFFSIIRSVLNSRYTYTYIYRYITFLQRSLTHKVSKNQSCQSAQTLRSLNRMYKFLFSRKLYLQVHSLTEGFAFWPRALLPYPRSRRCFRLFGCRELLVSALQLPFLRRVFSSILFFCFGTTPETTKKVLNSRFQA